MRSLSVELKLAFAVVALCALAGAAGAWVAGGIFGDDLDEAVRSTLHHAVDAFEAQERSDIEKLASTLDGLLANDDLRRAFVARDRAKLLALATPVFETLKEHDRITHWYFIEPDPSRAVFLRVHKPELFGDRVDRVTLMKAAETRDLGAGKELGRTAFALRAVRPWFHEGKLLGYVELAEEIDHFLTAMKARTGDDYGLLVKKKFLDERAWANVLAPRSNTWNDRPDVVVVDTTTFTEGIVDHDGDVESLPDGGTTLGEAQRGGRAYLRGMFPVRDAAGRKVGALFVLHDFTKRHGTFELGLFQTFVVMLALGLACAAVICTILRMLVFGRLSRARRTLEARAARSGVPPGRIVQLRSEDEIGRIEALLDRALFPAAAGDAPPGAAPERAASGRADAGA